MIQGNPSQRTGPDAMAHAWRPLPMMHIYDKGGTVKETGPGWLKKGEKVIPVKESRTKSAMGGGEKKSSSKKSGKSKSKSKSAGPKKHVHTMHIKHADNGGWIATHDMQPPEGGGGEPMPKPEDHIIPPGIENLQAHVADHLSQEPEEEQQQQPAPGGPAGPAPGGPMAGGM
jgi:hypothetical protein